ncbi:pyocin knob domain-containing protein [Pseudomonas sp. E2-15]
MARQEIILGAPPQGLGGDPPRTASMKINAMTQELYQWLDATTKGGWGAATPSVMPDGYDANDLTGNRVVAFNEGKNLPVKGATTSYWFVETLDFGSGYRYQRAASFVIPGATFVRQRHATGGWTTWKKIIEQGDFGVGAKDNMPYSGLSVNPDTYTTGGDYIGQFIVDGAARSGWLKVFAGSDGSVCGQTYLNGDGAMYSRAKSANVWSPWFKQLKRGDLGLGGDNLYTGNLDALVSFAPIGLSQYRCNQTTTGSLPPGYVNNAPFDGCTVVVSKYNIDWCRMWLSGGTGGQGGAIGGTFSRTIAGGSQGAWVLEYNAVNALNPVDNANGRAGLMDDRYIGSWRVNRIRSGYMVASAQIDNISMAANETKNVPFTSPVAFPDWGKSSIVLNFVPSQDSYTYGVVGQTMTSPTSGYVYIRNGGTAQLLVNVRLTISGYWF